MKSILNKEKLLKNNKKGITVITLVIIVVVIIILLAAVVMGLDNNILQNAMTAREELTKEDEMSLIQIAYSSVMIDSLDGFVTYDKLHKELSKATNVEVTLNTDQTLRVKFIESENVYNVDDGKITKAIDFESIIADALENPRDYKHPEQSSTNGDIGIGTDGETVNMDLWTYYVINGNEISLGNGVGTGGTSGYKNANVKNGEIIGKVPQYIKLDGKNEFYLVTSMDNCFYGCQSLVKAPEIPNSVISMCSTFRLCRLLAHVSKIPNGVINMDDTFYYCESLTKVPEIPNNVTNMNNTFFNCDSITEVSRIPNSVTNMYSTFQGCSSLVKAPVISSNVTNMDHTFAQCKSLKNAPRIPNGVTSMIRNI